MGYVKLVIAFILSFFQIINPFFQFVLHGGIDNYFEDWSASQKYTKDYAVTLVKDPDKDFVVLNFADIQWSGDGVYGEDGEYTVRLIDDAIKKVKPDLITLTGDNSSSMVGYLRLAKILDSYKIPWAPIMGNHDGENGNRIIEAWDSYILTNSEYCLFKFGPEDMGYGNYVLNITENDKIIHSIIMMDTHSDADDTEYGTINYGKNDDGTDSIGYDHLWANQIEWYKWAVNGVNSLAGTNVESTVYIHIPCYEFRDARDAFCYSNDESGETHWFLNDETMGFGSLYESICSPEGNNGFFETAVSLGSTKNIIVGHDHKNNMCVSYEGINLDYALKSGHGSYWTAEKMGSSVLTIDSNGHGTFSHVYYTGE